MMWYDKVIGIGGIGEGMLFITNDNVTLGRSESRLVELSAAKDYCKLHIVFHYIAALLCPNVHVYPIGYVGKDSHGASLLKDIRQVGMDTTYIAEDLSLPTMISICLQYPDRETCNFTASNSAGEKVTPEYVEGCMEMIEIGNSTIVAAIPEVPVESRVHMLRYGKEKGAFCVLSVPASEADEFKRSDIFSCCDLLAVNHAEALALAPGDSGQKETVERLYEYLRDRNPKIMLMVTLGKKGAYSVYEGNMEFIPYLPAEEVNTTGAGDACLGGVIAGLAMKMPFQKMRDDLSFGDTLLSSAVELGTLCAGIAVEDIDSIAKHIDAGVILKRIEKYGWKREPWFL